jgi:hypothetical protein
MIYLCNNEEVLEQQSMDIRRMMEVCTALDTAEIPWEWESSFRRWNGDNIRRVRAGVVAHTEDSEIPAIEAAVDLITSLSRPYCDCLDPEWSISLGFMKATCLKCDGSEDMR